ncbi:hypothetical protein ONS87_06965 [Caldimonas thermodepolymerans]|uniref:HD domain-containing protein n=2 Tax=Caldimonas thermodepolymerans TaxID=215580 RepID=A0AA46DCH4_9BURK|nr:hypothetical protein [Caldimonas thermodepolymerans]TCP06590.1 hypothetical protein EV676_10673 [Caldimonas thermodepolymerans]UZG49354.1 hypothetical protein ONS87_06965 [Caldimonas thermodepolymerans]
MTRMTTASGKVLDLLQPSAQQIDIRDIAWHLAHICRFNGAASRHYSVAEHSLHVSLHVELQGLPPAAQLAALLHDAHEAYCGDVTTPVKEALGAAWSQFEWRLQRAVHKALRVSTAFAAHCRDIVAADHAVMLKEVMVFLPEACRALFAHISVLPSEVDIRSETDFAPEDWARAFLDRYHELRYALDEQLDELGATASGPAQPQPHPDALVRLAEDILDPEVYGHAVTDEVRRRARQALGRPAA